MGSPHPAGTTAGTLMVISGSANLLSAAAISFTCLGPLAVVPALAGIAELVVGLAIMGRHPNSRVQLVSVLGLLAGFFTANPVSMGLEIASLITQARNPRQLEG